MTSKELAELRSGLVKAKHRLSRPESWAKNGGDCTDTFCAITSCNFIGGERECDAYVALWEALPAEAIKHKRDGALLDVFNYNDDPSTTHADIMALFDRAVSALDIQSFESLLSIGNEELAATREVRVDVLLDMLNDAWALYGVEE
jgi:hypothetical protein